MNCVVLRLFFYFFANMEGNESGINNASCLLYKPCYLTNITKNNLGAEDAAITMYVLVPAKFC
jgi:hypothetical protein